MRVGQIEEAIDIAIRTDDLAAFFEVMHANVNPSH